MLRKSGVGQQSVEDYMKTGGVLERQTTEKYFIKGEQTYYEVLFSQATPRTGSGGLETVEGIMDELGTSGGNGIARRVSVILRDSKGLSPESINGNIRLLLEQYTANLIRQIYGYTLRSDNGVLYLETDVRTPKEAERLIKAVRRYDRKINSIGKAGDAVLHALHLHIGVLDLKEE